jgi:hypothetical protein
MYALHALQVCSMFGLGVGCDDAFVVWHLAVHANGAMTHLKPAPFLTTCYQLLNMPAVCRLVAAADAACKRKPPLSAVLAWLGPCLVTDLGQGFKQLPKQKTSPYSNPVCS